MKNGIAVVERHLMSLIGMVVAALLAACAGSSTPPPPVMGSYQPKEERVIRKRVDYATAQLAVLPGAAQVGGVGSVLDGEGIPGFKPLTVRPFLPQDPSGLSRPAVVIFGNGSADDPEATAWAGALARHGFVALVAAWRTPADRPPHPEESAVVDIWTVLRWVNEHAGDYAVLADRIAVLGCGTGGAAVVRAMRADPEAVEKDKAQEYDRLPIPPYNRPGGLACARLALVAGGGAGSQADDSVPVHALGASPSPEAIAEAVGRLVSDLVETRTSYLSVKIGETDSGGARRTPGGGMYPAGIKVSVVPEPGPGLRFMEWTGDIRGWANPLVLDMTKDYQFTPLYRVIEDWSEFTLKVNVVGQGSVLLDPPGGVYPKGTWVRLYKLPAAGWKHREIAPAVTRHSTYLDLYIDRPSEIEVVFDRIKSPANYSLTVASEGEGSVALDPPGGSYTEGQVVRVATSPAAGWRFGYWSGDTREGSATAHIVMNADKQLTAGFVPMTKR
jgi:hypothetical protein